MTWFLSSLQGWHSFFYYAISCTSKWKKNYIQFIMRFLCPFTVRKVPNKQTKQQKKNSGQVGALSIVVEIDPNGKFCVLGIFSTVKCTSQSVWTFPSSPASKQKSSVKIRRMSRWEFGRSFVLFSLSLSVCMGTTKVLYGTVSDWMPATTGKSERWTPTFGTKCYHCNGSIDGFGNHEWNFWRL